ncbi:hypothetical protein Glove_84g69 [Diversispora epigaea]|uniref:Uncharacterized protein n=1 Tax=Diversispora epigaea TaxID=1348612 RepID=A0A397JHZ5_9GLOM|nr:hypothetical protein Glove_84g69 [Diversispora epigaea]
MEVIDNEFYVYSKDINYIDDSFFLSKQKVFDDNSSSEVTNLARSKLLFAHRNINESLKEKSKGEVSSLTGSNNFLDKRWSDLSLGDISSSGGISSSGSISSSKHARTDNIDGITNDINEVNDGTVHDGMTEGSVRNEKKCKSFVRTKKEKASVRSPQSGLRSSAASTIGDKKE